MQQDNDSKHTSKLPSLAPKKQKIINFDLVKALTQTQLRCYGRIFNMQLHAQTMLKKFQYHTAVKDSGYLKLLVADIAAKGGNEFFSCMIGVDNFYSFFSFFFCLKIK